MTCFAETIVHHGYYKVHHPAFVFFGFEGWQLPACGCPVVAEFITSDMTYMYVDSALHLFCFSTLPLQHSYVQCWT